MSFDEDFYGEASTADEMRLNAAKNAALNAALDRATREMTSAPPMSPQYTRWPHRWWCRLVGHRMATYSVPEDFTFAPGAMLQIPTMNLTPLPVPLTEGVVPVAEENTTNEPISEQTVDVLMDLAKHGAKEDFCFLAGASGVPAAKHEAMWRGTRRRLGVATPEEQVDPEPVTGGWTPEEIERAAWTFHETFQSLDGAALDFLDGSPGFDGPLVGLEVRGERLFVFTATSLYAVDLSTHTAMQAGVVLPPGFWAWTIPQNYPSPFRSFTET